MQDLRLIRFFKLLHKKKKCVVHRLRINICKKKNRIHKNRFSSARGDHVFPANVAQYYTGPFYIRP